MQGRRVSEALSLLSQLKDEDPLSPETRGLELELMISTRRWNDAAELSHQLLTLFPSSARIRYLAGRVCYQHKDYPSAQEHFEEADRLHPHWLTRYWSGKSSIQRGDYEQAEASLVGLAADHPRARLDLAWLYERRGQPERALEQVEAYLVVSPGDALAGTQQRRLRASLLAPAELVDEVDSLLGLGEAIRPEVVPTYVQRLLESGRGAEARRFVARHGEEWTPRTAASVAWVCHGLQAYDLAVRLFLLALEENAESFKLLSALESAARHAGRLDDVFAHYERLAPAHKNLYGRLRALRRT